MQQNPEANWVLQRVIKSGRNELNWEVTWFYLTSIETMKNNIPK